LNQKLIFLLAITTSFCTPALQLTDQERLKLDQQLQSLFEKNPQETFLDVSRRSNGEKEYGVIIRASNAEEIRAQGVQVGSVYGDVITARITVGELRKILSLQSVRAVQNGSKNYPQ